MRDTPSTARRRSRPIPTSVITTAIKTEASLTGYREELTRSPSKRCAADAMPLHDLLILLQTLAAEAATEPALLLVAVPTYTTSPDQAGNLTSIFSALTEA